jgi:hypothetical protein
VGIVGNGRPRRQNNIARRYRFTHRYYHAERQRRNDLKTVWWTVCGIPKSFFGMASLDYIAMVSLKTI